MKSLVIVCLCLGLVAGLQEEYSEEDILKLQEFSKILAGEYYEGFNVETDLRVGRKCIYHSDCGSPDWTCEHVEDALVDLVNTSGHGFEIPRLKRMARIEGKECVQSLDSKLRQHPTDAVVARIQTLYAEMKTILGDDDGKLSNYGESLEIDFDDLDPNSINAPVQRISDIGGTDPNFLLYFILLRDDGIDLDSNIFLILALLSSQGSGGIDNNLFSNPFLLYVLLDDNSGSSNSDLLLYLLLFSSNSPVGAFGAPPPLRKRRQIASSSEVFGLGSLYSSPLLLYLALGDDADLDDLLPLLLLSGGFGGIGGGGGGCGLGGLLPILLLSNSSFLSGDDNLLAILLISGSLGGGGGAYGPGGCPSGPVVTSGGGLDCILPLLLLTNTSGLTDNPLLLILLLGGGGLGGAGGGLCGGGGGLGYGGGGLGYGGGNNLLPLLLLTNTSGDNSDLLLLLLASGGLGGGVGGGYGGGLGSLLPILLLTDTDLDGDNLLPILLLSGTLGAGGLGAGGGINSILPLLLLKDADSDNVVLLLFLFGALSAGNPFSGPVLG